MRLLLLYNGYVITSNDDPKSSTVISEQPPTGLIARHIKITARTTISWPSNLYITGKWVNWLVTHFKNTQCILETNTNLLINGYLPHTTNIND